MQKVLEPIQRVRFTNSIREKKGPSLGKIQVKAPHQRSPYAMKVEDRSHEETERQQRCARSKAWNLAKSIHKLKEEDKAAFYYPAAQCVLPTASTKQPEEREFVVDSGASMHMVSKKDLNSAELETMRTSRSPFVVPGLSASSSSTTSSSTSSSSSSQVSISDNRDYASDITGIENPVPERSGSTSEERRGKPLHESTKTEN